MSTSVPAVSVVIPVYNAESTLADTVASVIAQTVHNWELILVDDASTDGSTAVAAQYAQGDARIRFLQNERNLGVAETRNRAIRAARGSYIALLDSDDLWNPEKLERQMALADATGAELIYCSYAIIDEAGKRCCDDFIVPKTTDREKMLVRSVISCSTALIRRGCLLEHPFRSEYVHEDLALWLELLGTGCRACGCPEVLASYRVSSRSRSGNKRKSALGRWEIYRKCMGYPATKSAWLFTRYAVRALKKYRRRG